MSNFDWSDYAGPDGDYPDPYKFENPGDSIAGTIERIDVVTNDNGTTPVMDIHPDDEDARTVWVSQQGLKRRMAELRPQRGDRIAIVFTGLGQASKPGYSPPKLFDVKLVQGDGTTPPEATETPQAATEAPVSADSLI